MNASEELPKQQPPGQGSPQEEIKKQAAPRDGRATGRIGAVISGLEKALDGLFKAQDHLNTAADQGGDDLSKMINGINQSLRGLQRELSQVIYRLDNRR